MRQCARGQPRAPSGDRADNSRVYQPLRHELLLAAPNVSGNMPFRTEIAPILIVARLEEFAYGEATAIAVVLLMVSLAMLVVINRLERWSVRHER